jgi:hypothetical protein
MTPVNDSLALDWFSAEFQPFYVRFCAQLVHCLTRLQDGCCNECCMKRRDSGLHILEFLP